MRIFVLYLDIRHVLDLTVGETVGEVKSQLRRKFDLNVQNGSDENDLIMQLIYAGSSLQDEWVVTDIGIPPGATLRCLLQERIKTYLYVKSVYNGEVVTFTDYFNVWETKVEYLRTMIQDKTGLPVSVFRVTTVEGRELYDCHLLKEYNIDVGDTVHMETWDGWNEFLISATKGQLTPTMKHITNIHDDPALARFQLRVALFIAAHYGYNQLASQLLKSGARCDEAVGQHPSREWCKQNIHPDCYKTPAHESAQTGHLQCLRVFLHHNPAVILAKDFHGLTPCNVSRRFRQTECFKLLIAEQFRSRSMEGLNLGIYLRVRKWCERARDRAIAYHSKDSANPILLDMVKRHNITAVVGQKVQVDGFGENMQTAAPSKKIRHKLKGHKLSHTLSSIQSSREITPAPSITEDLNKKIAITRVENKKKSSDTSINGSSGIVSRLSDCKTCLELNSETRCNTGTRVLSRTGKELPGIRNLEREKELRRFNRSVYRWIADGEEGERTTPTDERTSVFTTEDNTKVNSQLEAFDDSKKMTKETECKDNIFLTEIDKPLKAKLSPLQHRKFNVISETHEVKISPRAWESLSSESSDALDKKHSKMPPIEFNALVCKGNLKVVSNERKISDKTEPKLSQLGPKHPNLTSPRNSMSSRRTRSMDDMVDTFDLYKKITGQSLRESAVHSMEVANSFSEKEWLQQVRMAILLNRNTFKRRISQQRSFTLD